MLTALRVRFRRRPCVSQSWRRDNAPVKQRGIRCASCGRAVGGYGGGGGETDVGGGPQLSLLWNRVRFGGGQKQINRVRTISVGISMAKTKSSVENCQQYYSFVMNLGWRRSLRSPRACWTLGWVSRIFDAIVSCSIHLVLLSPSQKSAHLPSATSNPPPAHRRDRSQNEMKRKRTVFPPLPSPRDTFCIVVAFNAACTAVQFCVETRVAWQNRVSN